MASSNLKVQAQGDNHKVFTNIDVGGPIFVHVENNRINRVEPIHYPEEEASPWKITARGGTFSPPPKAALSQMTMAFRRRIYSPRRIQYPMKRVGFEPGSISNVVNRGKGEVYVAATSTDVGAKAVEKGAIIYGGGRIVGAAGLLLGLAKNRGLAGICLLGTTTGLKADQEAAHSVFKLLLKMFGMENSIKLGSEEKR